MTYQQRDVSCASEGLALAGQRGIVDVSKSNNPGHSSAQIASLEVVNEITHSKLFHHFLQRR